MLVGIIVTDLQTWTKRRNEQRGQRGQSWPRQQGFQVRWRPGGTSSEAV